MLGVRLVEGAVDLHAEDHPLAVLGERPGGGGRVFGAVEELAEVMGHHHDLITDEAFDLFGGQVLEIAVEGEGPQVVEEAAEVLAAHLEPADDDVEPREAAVGLDPVAEEEVRLALESGLEGGEFGFGRRRILDPGLEGLDAREAFGVDGLLGAEGQVGIVGVHPLRDEGVLRVLECLLAASQLIEGDGHLLCADLAPALGEVLRIPLSLGGFHVEHGGGEHVRPLHLGVGEGDLGAVGERRGHLDVCPALRSALQVGPDPGHDVPVLVHVERPGRGGSHAHLGAAGGHRQLDERLRGAPEPLAAPGAVDVAGRIPGPGPDDAVFVLVEVVAVLDRLDLLLRRAVAEGVDLCLHGEFLVEGGLGLVEGCQFGVPLRVGQGAGGVLGGHLLSGERDGLRDEGVEEVVPALLEFLHHRQRHVLVGEGDLECGPGQPAADEGVEERVGGECLPAHGVPELRAGEPQGGCESFSAVDRREGDVDVGTEPLGQRLAEILEGPAGGPGHRRADQRCEVVLPGEVAVTLDGLVPGVDRRLGAQVERVDEPLLEEVGVGPVIEASDDAARRIGLLLDDGASEDPSEPPERRRRAQRHASEQQRFDVRLEEARRLPALRPRPGGLHARVDEGAEADVDAGCERPQPPASEPGPVGEPGDAPGRCAGHVHRHDGLERASGADDVEDRGPRHVEPGGVADDVMAAGHGVALLPVGVGDDVAEGLEQLLLVAGEIRRIGRRCGGVERLRDGLGVGVHLGQFQPGLGDAVFSCVEEPERGPHAHVEPLVEPVDRVDVVLVGVAEVSLLEPVLPHLAALVHGESDGEMQLRHGRRLAESEVLEGRVPLLDDRIALVGDDVAGVVVPGPAEDRRRLPVRGVEASDEVGFDDRGDLFALGSRDDLARDRVGEGGGPGDADVLADPRLEGRLDVRDLGLRHRLLDVGRPRLVRLDEADVRGGDAPEELLEAFRGVGGVEFDEQRLEMLDADEGGRHLGDGLRLGRRRILAALRHRSDEVGPRVLEGVEALLLGCQLRLDGSFAFFGGEALEPILDVGAVGGAVARFGFGDVGPGLRTRPYAGDGCPEVRARLGGSVDASIRHAVPLAMACQTLGGGSRSCRGEGAPAPLTGHLPSGR